MFVQVKSHQNFHLVKQSAATEVLLSQIKPSSFFVISYDVSLNKILQNEQMDCTIRFWNNETGVVCLKYFDSNFFFFCGQIPRTSLKSYWNQQSRWTFPNCCSSQWIVLMLLGRYWNLSPPTKEKRSIRISSAFEIVVSTLFMGHFKVVVTSRIGSWQRYFVQCTIFLKSHLLRLTNIWKFVNLILLLYHKSIYFWKHTLTDFILFDTWKQIVFLWTVCTISFYQIFW